MKRGRAYISHEYSQVQESLSKIYDMFYYQIKNYLKSNGITKKLTKLITTMIKPYIIQ